MGYIRDNEDYYVSIGHHPSRARELVALDEAKIDPGFCNPIKAKLADEEEKAVLEKLKDSE